MAKYTTADIRNIALVGHGDSGKTTLAEAMLFTAKAVNRQGSVDDGSSHSDWDEQEKEKKNSIYSSCLHLDWKDKTFNVIDNPGYPDFVGQALTSLRAVESVAIGVSATAGIGVNTRKMWEASGKEGLARFVVVTRIDGDNVDFSALLENIQETFGNQVIPLTLPIGEGRDFKGVVNVLNLPDDVPADVVGDASSVRDQLMETALEADDELLEKYLEGEEISAEALNRVLVLAVAQGKVVPLLVVNGKKGEGVEEVLDAIAEFAPSPITGLKRRFAAEAVEVAEGEEAVETEGDEIEPDENGIFVGQVFKIVIDPFIGKLSYIRIFSGSISTADHLIVGRTAHSNKIAQLFRMQGKDQIVVEKGITGDIIAIPKIDDVMVSDTVLTGKEIKAVAAMELPIPMVSLAVEPKSRGDEQKISGGLARLSEEDPTFHVHLDVQTKELVINGMSRLHLNMMIDRLKIRGVEVTSKMPKIPYRETITKRVSEVPYTHKKQSGGSGQYAKVIINMYPLERGKHYEFVDKIFGGVIDQSYRPSVDKGIQQKMVEGVVAGYPVVDVGVELIDGKTHPVDSKDIAFQIAGREVFKEAVMKAGPVLLEPVVNMEVTIPTRNMGDITGDVNSRRGRITGMDQHGAFQTIRCQVPLAEVTSYDAELRSITGGEGSYTMEFSHYDPVPPNIAQKVIAASKKTEEEEKSH